MELNRYPEAIKHYRDVLRYDSSNAQAHYQLGLAYDEIDNGKQAIIESIVAKQLLQKNNDSSRVAEIEAQLKTLFAKYSYRPEDFAGVKALIRR
ncbi:MAG: tetratricopeptide repeat protein [Nitrospinales bacterium]